MIKNLAKLNKEELPQLHHFFFKAIANITLNCKTLDSFHLKLGRRKGYPQVLFLLKLVRNS